MGVRRFLLLCSYTTVVFMFRAVNQEADQWEYRGFPLLFVLKDFDRDAILSRPSTPKHFLPLEFLVNGRITDRPLHPWPLGEIDKLTTQLASGSQSEKHSSNWQWKLYSSNFAYLKINIFNIIIIKIFHLLSLDVSSVYI